MATAKAKFLFGIEHDLYIFSWRIALTPIGKLNASRLSGDSLARE